MCFGHACACMPYVNLIVSYMYCDKAVPTKESRTEEKRKEKELAQRIMDQVLSDIHLFHPYFHFLIPLECTLFLISLSPRTHPSAPHQRSYPAHCSTQICKHNPIRPHSPAKSYDCHQPQARARAETHERRQREATRRKYNKVPQEVGWTWSGGSVDCVSLRCFMIAW